MNRHPSRIQVRKISKKSQSSEEKTPNLNELLSKKSKRERNIPNYLTLINTNRAKNIISQFSKEQSVDIEYQWDGFKINMPCKKFNGENSQDNCTND